MLPTRIFSGSYRTCLNGSGAIQQCRWNSSNAQSMRDACRKIREFVYPSSIPSHFLGVSTALEQVSTSGTLFPDRELVIAFKRRYGCSEDFGTMDRSLNCQR